MIRLLLVVCFSLLCSAQRSIGDFGYDPCDRAAKYIADGEFNLAGEGRYRSNRQAELVCDFPKFREYGIKEIAWIKMGGDGSCLGARPIHNDINVNSERGKSTLTISDYDRRDYGLYRCYGKKVGDRYNDIGRYGSSRRDYDHVYMEVDFEPDERSGRYRYSQSRYPH